MFRQARAFAVAITFFGLLSAVPASADIREPLPRFADKVCPGVAGLPVDQAELIVGRIRTTAEELGLFLADPKVCEPNIIVAVVADGQAYLRDLEERKPYVFQSMNPTERRELIETVGPSRAFLSTAVRNRDGIPVYHRSNLTQIPQLQANAAHSRIYTASRRDIVNALVLLDASAVEGKSVAQLADHATMLALLPKPPAGDDASILELFEEGGEAITGLTKFDRAYLAGMYEGIPNLPSDVRMAEVEERVRQSEAQKVE